MEELDLECYVSVFNGTGIETVAETNASFFLLASKKLWHASSFLWT